MNIGYLSEPIPLYQKALTESDTLEALAHTVGLYERVAWDAVEVVEKMDSDDFARWRAGLALERKKVFAGEEFMQKFGALLMPEVMVQVSIIAEHFKVPWGLAFIRLKETGKITENNGVARLSEAVSAQQVKHE